MEIIAIEMVPIFIATEIKTTDYMKTTTKKTTKFLKQTSTEHFGNGPRLSRFTIQLMPSDVNTVLTNAVVLDDL